MTNSKLKKDFNKNLSLVLPQTWNQISLLDFLAGKFDSLSKKIDNDTISSNIENSLVAVSDLYTIHSSDPRNAVTAFTKRYKTLLSDIYLNHNDFEINDEIILKLIQELRPKQSKTQNNFTVSNFKDALNEKKLHNSALQLGEFTVHALDQIENNIWHPIPTIFFIRQSFEKQLAPYESKLAPFVNVLLTELLLVKTNYGAIPFSQSFLNPTACTNKKKRMFRDNVPFLEYSDGLAEFIDFLSDHHNTCLGHIKSTTKRGNLSDKQQEILNVFEKNRKSVITPRMIEFETNIARPTINQILRKLESINLITRRGKGRATAYTLMRSS